MTGIKKTKQQIKNCFMTANIGNKFSKGTKNE